MAGFHAEAGAAVVIDEDLIVPGVCAQGWWQEKRWYLGMGSNLSGGFEQVNIGIDCSRLLNGPRQKARDGIGAYEMGLQAANIANKLLQA